MNRDWSKLILSIFLAGGVSACQSLTSILPVTSVSQSTPITLTDPASLSTIENKIYQQINQHRQSLNLSPLEVNEIIAQQARIHSERMATKTIPFSHDGFEQRIQQISRQIPYQEVAENLSVNQNFQDPAATAVQKWLKSSHHRQNIEGDFDVTGIGVARNSEGEYYFTQIFLKKPQVPTSESPSLRLPVNSPSVTTYPLNKSPIIALEEKTHQQVNQYRLSQNLPLLRLDARVSYEARLFSEKMAKGSAPFSHDGFENRVKAIEKSISLQSAGENLAVNQGYNDPVTVAVQGWIKSPGHRANMVGDFDVTGIGIAKNAKGEYYFTQLFVKKH